MPALVRHVNGPNRETLIICENPFLIRENPQLNKKIARITGDFFGFMASEQKYTFFRREPHAEPLPKKLF